MARPRLLRLLSVPLFSLAVAAAGTAFAAPVSAAPAVNPPAASTAVADQGAAYLADLINSSGFIANSSGAANLGGTGQAILALHAAGVGGTKANLAATYFAAHIATYLGGGTATTDDPGRLAYAILVAAATGSNPTAYGTPATDLVSRLLATQNTYTKDGAADAGLFGAADPTYDGTTRQGLALAALHAAGITNAAGNTWLVDQQCADGGWMAYRADTTTACTPPDPTNYSGEDTNDTAYAIEGLVAQGVTPPVDPLPFLHAIQSSDGGFGYYGGSADPDSDALVLQALAALGADAAGTSWTKGSATPYTALASFQLSCATATPGAFFYPGSKAASLLATLQAVPGAAAAPFPLSASTPAAAAPTSCASAPSTPTTAPSTPSTPPASGNGQSAATPPATVTPTATAPATTAATPTAVAGAAATLPFTGSQDTATLVVVALLLLGAGALVFGLSKRAGAHRL